MLDLFVTAPRGAEPVLVEELAGMGMTAHVAVGGVKLRGALEDAYRVCLWSRVAGRVLIAVGRTSARAAEELREGVRGQAWERWLSVGATFRVEVEGTNPALRHTHFTAQVVKDGIVDRFRASGLARPVVAPDGAELDVAVRIHGERAFIAVDLSQGSLHRRGTREATGAAPLRENVAAAVLWRGRWPSLMAEGAMLMDPACGTGTLLWEGLGIALDRAPRLDGSMPCPGLQSGDVTAWARLQTDAARRASEGSRRTTDVRGLDRDPAMIRLAREAAARLGWSERVQLDRGPVHAITPPSAKGLVVCNPPYGERMGSHDEAREFYAALGAALIERFSGWSAAIIAGDATLGRALGLHARRRYPLRNGPIDCQVLCWDDLGPRDVEATRRAHQEAARTAEPPSEQRVALENRLRKRSAHLAAWAGRDRTDAYRVYDADLPDFAVAIDRYADWLVIQEYAPGAEIPPDIAKRRLRIAVDVASEVLSVPRERIVVKRRRRMREGEQYEKLAEGRRRLIVCEEPVRAWAELVQHIDTGLFLDHRKTRRMLGKLAKGRHCLNLFCYTGVATLHMAKGGAKTTTSVDLSNTYLDWAADNFALEGLDRDAHTLVRADVLRWVEDAGRAERRWDLIFVDPPTYSKSKAMDGDFDVQRDHAQLLAACLRLLAPEGELVFSTNLRSFKPDGDLADRLGARVDDITGGTIPEDFSRDPKIHRCYRIRRTQV